MTGGDRVPARISQFLLIGDADSDERRLVTFIILNTGPLVTMRRTGAHHLRRVEAAAEF